MQQENTPWPTIEIPSDDEPIPTIPPEYEVLGLCFKSDPIPSLKVKDVQFEPKKIQDRVKSSLKTFITILKKITEHKNIEEELYQLEKVHTNINKYINKCKLWEARKGIERMQIENNLKKQELLKKLEDAMK